LANDRESHHKRSGHHQDPVIVTLGNQARQVIDLDCEGIDDPDHLEHLEIVRRSVRARVATGRSTSSKNLGVAGSAVIHAMPARQKFLEGRWKQ